MCEVLLCQYGFQHKWKFSLNLGLENLANISTASWILDLTPAAVGGFTEGVFWVPPHEGCYLEIWLLLSWWSAAWRTATVCCLPDRGSCSSQYEVLHCTEDDFNLEDKHKKVRMLLLLVSVLLPKQDTCLYTHVSSVVIWCIVFSSTRSGSRWWLRSTPDNTLCFMPIYSLKHVLYLHVLNVCINFSITYFIQFVYSRSYTQQEHLYHSSRAVHWIQLVNCTIFVCVFEYCTIILSLEL